MVSRWIVFTVLILSSTALAHDADQRSNWIDQGGYKNKNGSLCCGVKDCERLRQEDIEPRVNGIWLPRFGELVPYNEATPSEDEFSYRCHNAVNARQCFFWKYGAS